MMSFNLNLPTVFAEASVNQMFPSHCSRKQLLAANQCQNLSMTVTWHKIHGLWSTAAFMVYYQQNTLKRGHKQLLVDTHGHPDSKVHGANKGPIWGRQDPCGPHVDPMILAIWVSNNLSQYCERWKYLLYAIYIWVLLVQDSVCIQMRFCSYK